MTLRCTQLPVAGTFVECCKTAPQAVPLSTAVLELVRTQRVHAHPEPYVRRASLLAASQVSPYWSCFIWWLLGIRGVEG